MSVARKDAGTSRRSARAQKRKQRGLSTEAITLIVIGVALAVVAGLFLLFSGSSGSSASATKSQGAGVLVRDDSIRFGPPDAKVTIVEFLDYECEACAAMHPTFERIRKEYGDRVTTVIRYFPLHKNSVLAFKAAEAAGRQGKYEAMYAMLFEQQRVWGEKNEPQTEVFVDFARRLGLDVEQFRRDLGDPTIDEKIGRDRADAMAAGVRGTPTFFINGVQAGNVMPYDQMKSKIEAALR
ncbi:MAG: thioredoxin domain-containing protein [Chloroflexi bacterium]|nr:thioredoxin domain-containing protein [Chloroflexota bacterium]